MASISGIYEIRNKLNGKSYIGSTVDLGARRREHWGRLRRGTHPNKYLSNAWNKYGESVFEFNIIGMCPKEKLIAIEQHMLDSLGPAYNVCPKAGTSLGRRHTAESRHRMSVARTGRKLSAELCQKISDRLTGTTRSEAIRRKISVGLTGRPVSADTRRKLSESAKRRGISDETRRKMGEAKKHSLPTQEHLRKIHEARRGQRETRPEVIQKLRQSHLGKKQSPETIARRVAAIKTTVMAKSAEERSEQMQRAWITRRRIYGPSGGNSRA